VNTSVSTRVRARVGALTQYVRDPDALGVVLVQHAAHQVLGGIRDLGPGVGVKIQMAPQHALEYLLRGVPQKGGSPHSMMYRMTPADQMSASGP